MTIKCIDCEEEFDNWGDAILHFQQEHLFEIFEVEEDE